MTMPSDLPHNTTSRFQNEVGIPESEPTFQELQIILTEAALTELRNRAEGAPEKERAEICLVSDEAERLLLSYGDLGEIWGYIAFAKETRWEAMEPVLLENAPAGMLMSYLRMTDIEWPEAIAAIEERFDPESIEKHMVNLFLTEKYPDLHARLSARVKSA